ncbi:MAG TPA: DUF3185 domain-containing protein [bacterium]|jgi:hypothetical protein|nr:DUF3185 domain-containing protein [bacterium]
MKTGKILGIILIIFGCISLSYAGISYTRREKVFQVGSLVATADTRNTIPLSPIAGAVALVVGLGLLVYREGN